MPYSLSRTRTILQFGRDKTPNLRLLYDDTCFAVCMGDAAGDKLHG
jgi:hypothetical protein